MKRSIRDWKSITVSFIMAFLVMFSFFGGAVHAEGSDDEIYTIRGYNKKDIIKDSSGQTVSGYAFCLDDKAQTPSGQEYIRIMLSELEGTYQKRVADTSGSEVYMEEKHISQASKERLIKLLVDEKNISTFIKKECYQKLLDEEDYVIGKIIEKEKECDWTYKDGWIPSADVTKAKNKEITEDEFKEKLSTEYRKVIKKKIKYLPSSGEKQVIQRIIWALVHDETDWEAFVNDDGSNSGGHKANYKLAERDYSYPSASPYTDEHSLWNVFYMKIINYIDGLPDYMAQGYDAWIYICDDNEHQNMLGGYFKTIKFVKTDAVTGDTLTGAHIKLLDYNGNVAGEWDDATKKLPLTDFEIDKTYTIQETIAPAGYMLTGEIKFSVDAEGNVTVNSEKLDTACIYIKDTLTTASISKKSAANNSELAGATLKLSGEADWNLVKQQLSSDTEHSVELITDSSGAASGIKWTSTDKELIVKGLTTDKEYELEEMIAPEGYVISEKIKFKLEDNGDGKTVVKVFNKNTNSYEASSKVEMIDELDVGKLVITKSIEGIDVTDEEKAGALKFTVKNKAGKYLDANGILHTETVEITLDKFTKGADGKYTLTFDKVASGEYTVVETNTAIDGYVIKSTSVTSATGTVTYAKTATVEIKDSYDKKEDESTTTTGGSTKKTKKKTSKKSSTGSDKKSSSDSSSSKSKSKKKSTASTSSDGSTGGSKSSSSTKTGDDARADMALSFLIMSSLLALVLASYRKY